MVCFYQDPIEKIVCIGTKNGGITVTFSASELQEDGIIDTTLIHYGEETNDEDFGDADGARIHNEFAHLYSEEENAWYFWKWTNTEIDWASNEYDVQIYQYDLSGVEYKVSSVLELA